MTKEYATTYLRCSGFSEEQIKAIEGAFSCPSAVVDCEDCPAYEDTISRKAVLDVTWEEPSYTDALNVLTEVRDKVKALPPVNPQKPKSEWQKVHEILKAYSDGANYMADKTEGGKE